MYISTLNSQEFLDLFKPLCKDDVLMLCSINPFKCVCIRNVLVTLLLFFCLPSFILNTHIMACPCVLGIIPHTLALGSSVPGLWAEVSTVTWFAAFCPRRHISL